MGTSDYNSNPGSGWDANPSLVAQPEVNVNRFQDEVATPDSVDANRPNGGGARIGRPPQWTESRSRKLARLYTYTTLPMEKVINKVFPNKDVKYDLRKVVAPSSPFRI